jgi:folate-dependent phosphoribosylglycinamide formyltransferase PurN
LFSADENFPKQREEIFEFCKVVYPETVNAKREIRKWSANIWSEVDKKELQGITRLISQTKNIAALTEKLKFGGPDETVPWLNHFISFLTDYKSENLLNHQTEPILPNQNGSFCAKDKLFVDGEIDETLKDISAELGYDFRDELLDSNIYLYLPQSRTKNEIDVAKEIIELITPELGKYPRTNKTKQISKKLYLWFNKNEEKAKKCFGDLYKSRLRLCDDDEIAENFRKAEELSDLMEEFDVSSVSDLRKILQANITYSIEQKQQITKEVLASLGVTSKEEWEAALKDKNIANKFIHISTPSVEMFQFAQRLISRAKENIIKHLQMLPDYDCSEMEELATTVIGGIKKNGLMIHVVVRPSDNGKVIVYYSSEKDTLDYENAELWIDDGIHSPTHLTLGKVLKNIGINKIPIVDY